MLRINQDSQGNPKRKTLRANIVDLKTFILYTVVKQTTQLLPQVLKQQLYVAGAGNTLFLSSRGEKSRQQNTTT